MALPFVSLSVVDEVTERVRRSLASLEQAYVAAGRSLLEVGPADALAGRMLAAVPRPPVRADGPTDRYYSAAKVGELLGGLSVAAVEERRAARALLGVRIDGGVVVYPTFQFDGTGDVLPGLARVLRCVPADEDGDRRLAGWLRAPQPALGGRSVVTWLREGRPVDDVVDLIVIDLRG